MSVTTPAPSKRAATKAVKAVPARRRAISKGDPAIDEWLTSKGVEFLFHPEGLELSAVDLDKSMSNQARVFTKAEPSTVERYAEAIKRNEAFPPVILHKLRQKKLTLVDGVHRMLGAVRAGRETWSNGWYEITRADAKTLTMLMMEANVRHGLPTNVEERVQHAIWMIDNGAAREQAAAAVGVPLKEIDKRLAALNIRRRAENAGVTMGDWERLNGAIQTRLAVIATDEGLLAATSLALRANLSNSEVFELTTAMNTSRSAARQRQVVKDLEAVYAERIEQTGAGIFTHNKSKKGPTPKANYSRALAALNQLPENLALLADTFSSEERPEAAERARQQAARLTQLADALETKLD